MVRFTLRLPDELHGHLEAMAQASQRSLHAEILLLLAQATGEQRPAMGLLEAQIERARRERDIAAGQVRNLEAAIAALQKAHPTP